MNLIRTMRDGARRLAAPWIVSGGIATPRPAVDPAARERKREVITFWLYRSAERVISSIPRPVVLAIAAAAGNLAYDVARSKRRLVHENLANPMQRSPADPAVGRAARRAFRNYAKYLADMLRIGELTEAQAASLIRIPNVETLAEARAEGRGVIVCTVHVGGMDLLGPGLKLAGEALHVVADDTTYGRLYGHLAAERAKHNIFLIGWRNLRGLFRVLAEGGNLALFCDGGYRRGDVPVEFCGKPTTFPIGPATLAAKTGAPMLPVACRRDADNGFTARGLALIHCAGSEPAEVYRATQALADALAAVIMEDPGQWYMFRPVWPETDADRAHARDQLAAARRGDDWTKIGR